MMAELEQRRYSISEVADLVQVTPPMLRQWERRVARLRPKRTRAGRRYYVPADIEIVRLIKYLMRHQGMSLEAISRHLSQEDFKQGALPKSPTGALELVHRIADETKQLLARIERSS